ncbi:MAG: serine protease [Candidatus Hydrogenedentota bacterium]
MRSSIVGLTLCLALAAVSGAQVFSQEFVASSYDKVAPSVCMITYSSEVTNPASGQVSKRNTRAAGLIVSADGLVMAHGHMQLENSQPFNIKVVVGQGESEREYDAEALRKPEDINVCFLRIVSNEALNLPHVRFAPGGLDLGEPLLIIGLMGESLDYTTSIVERRVTAVLEKPRRTYCLDERIVFGYVGGPVVNASGNVVGVVGFDLSTNEGGDLYIRSGHPLVYQSALFQHYIDNPPGKETLDAQEDDAFLGVFTQPLTDDMAEYWNLPKEGGVVVSTVIADSPAAVAGLQAGDVITTFNEIPVRAKLDREILAFTKVIRDAGIGKAVPVKLLREGAPMDVSVTLTERPKSSRDAVEFEDTVFGLTVRELTTDVRLMLNLSNDVQGVIIRRVESGSYGQLAGLRAGMIIMNFGGHPVTTIEEFEAALAKVTEAKPTEITVFCRFGPRTGFFRIQPRWNNGN